MGLDADLAAYYDAEARAGVRGELDTMRLGIRRGFVDLMRREDRRRLVDVGSGPGRDTLAFQQGGFDTIGVDLAPANLVLMRERGAVGSAGSLYALPFADASSRIPPSRASIADSPCFEISSSRSAPTFRKSASVRNEFA